MYMSLHLHRPRRLAFIPIQRPHINSRSIVMSDPQLKWDSYNILTGSKVPTYTGTRSRTTGQSTERSHATVLRIGEV
jgi:hypothetical protein